MSKVFEDCFTALQTDMILTCLEYVEKKADKIYIYGSFEEKIISCDFFYCINGRVVKKHQLNDAVYGGNFRYDVSTVRQCAVLDILVEDIEKLYSLCNEYRKEMPTEIKIVYDVKKNSVRADYQYDLVYSNENERTSHDIVTEWFEEVQNLDNEKGDIV